SAWFVFQLDLVRVMWAVFPAACLWGASFPLALAAAAAPGEDPGRMVGSVYASNTVGAILGALTLSILAVPTIGTFQSQRLLMAFCVVAGVLMLIALMRGRAGAAGASPEKAISVRAGMGAVAAAVLAATALIWAIPGPATGMLAFGR